MQNLFRLNTRIQAYFFLLWAILQASTIFFLTGIPFLLAFISLFIPLFWFKSIKASLFLLSFPILLTMMSRLGMQSLKLQPDLNLKCSTFLTFLTLSYFLLTQDRFENNFETKKRAIRNLISAVPVFIFFFTFSIHGLYNFLAVFMSGDSRNHTLLIRNIIKNGYITSDQQAFYPTHFFTIPAVVANHFDGSTPIIGSVVGLATGYLFGTLVITFALSELASIKGLSLIESIIFGGIVTSATYLGIILMHGFYSAIWGLGVLTAVYILIEINSPRSKFAWIMLGVLFSLIAYQAWSLLAPIVLVGVLVHSLKGDVFFRRRDMYLFFLSAVLLTFTYLSVSKNGTFSRIVTLMKTDGGLSTMSLSAIVAVFAIVIAREIISWREYSRQFFYLSISLTTFVMFIWIGLLRAEQGKFLGYYNEKLIWIVAASICPIAMIHLLEKARGASKLSNALIGTSLLFLLSNVTPLQNSTWASLFYGWSAPNKEVASKIFEIENTSLAVEPIIFWYYSDPGNDRLGSFWSSSLSNPITDAISFNEAAAWAYSETGQPSDLCSLAIQVDHIGVVTLQENAVRDMIKNTCPLIAKKIRYVR